MEFLNNNILILVIYSILTFVFIGVTWYLKKAEISTVRLFLGIMGNTLLFGGLGLILSKNTSLPLIFWIVTLAAFLEGLVLVWKGQQVFQWYHKEDGLIESATTLIWIFVGSLSFITVFGVISSNPNQFATNSTAGIISMLIPIILNKSYQYALSIPRLKYRRWYYNPTAFLPVLEPINVIKINIQFTKIPNESVPNFEGYWVELPSDILLGTLFHYFIYSHNNRHRDYKRNPIPYTQGDLPIGWVLYKKNTAGQSVYLDMELSLKQNKIIESDTIYAQGFTD